MSNSISYVIKQVGIIVLIGILALIFLLIGLVIGYGVIGDGKNPFAILSPDKWQSIFSKFSGK
ncbi:MAG: DNA-directed RNA polymerase subunit beta [Streptococcus sp.]|nr:DNA-directed RNA polymerase subunit beta [Streptococcus sp.]